MKIKKDEAKHLTELYARANETGDENHWALVSAYYRKLAKIYKFNVNKVSISTMGYVNELKYCEKCKGLATGINGTEYIRARVPGSSKWAKIPVCPACIAKYYPEMHKVDNF